MSSQLFTSSNSIQLSNSTVYRPVCRLFIFLSFKCFCCGVLTALRYTYVIMYLYGLSIPIFVLNWESVKVFTLSSYMNVIIARIINAKDDGVGLKVRQTEKLDWVFRFAAVGYCFCLYSCLYILISYNLSTSWTEVSVPLMFNVLILPSETKYSMVAFLYVWDW